MKIGIDPGVSGAIALLDNDSGYIDVVDMPIMKMSKTKNQVNAAALRDIINDMINTSYYVHGIARERIGVWVERVSAMPGQGVASMFNFGMGFGIIQGVLAGTGMPVQFITPQQWKKLAGLIGADKDMARTKAIQLYPQAPLSRKKDIGRADAILIARYAE